MSLKKQLTSGSVWTIAASLLNNLSSFAVFVILARVLTPAQFGIVAFATIFIEVGRTLVVAGISDALVQRSEWDDAVASTGFWLNLVAGIVIAILLTLIAIGLSVENGDRTFALVMAALSVDLVIEGATAVHIAKLRRDFRFKQLATRGMLGRIVSGALGITLALTGWGVWALVLSRLMGSLLYSSVIWQASDFRPRKIFVPRHARAMMPFAAGQLGVQLLGQINLQAGALATGGLLGSAAIAQYRIGTRAISMIVSLVITPIQQTALSAFARLQHDRQHVASAYLRMTQACSIIACPTLFGLAATAPDFVTVVFGRQWNIAGTVLMILCLYVGPAVLNYFQSPALAAVGRSDLSFYRSAVGTASNLIFAIASAPYGVVAVAAALTIREHLTLPYNMALMKRAIGLPMRQSIAAIAPTYLCALGMFCLITYLRLAMWQELPPLLRLTWCIIVGGSAYITLMALFARQSVRKNWKELEPLLPPALLRRLPF